MLPLSVVVPLFNEQDSVRPLVQQLLDAVRPLGLDFELVLVDDGSQDRTAAVLAELSEAVPELVAVLDRLAEREGVTRAAVAIAFVLAHPSRPVAIVGTFAAMAAMGFSINTLSLFGLVLSIGIVVDDAIVVVENVERWIATGLAPRQAAEKAMEEVTGPVIGVALVLSAVFVPCAFIGGVTGLFFRQFALTVSVSTILSAINSLTLSPALAAILLRPHDARPDPLERLLDLLLLLPNAQHQSGFRNKTSSLGSA
jgi:multidrug efflux pump subunit AcrB